MLVSFIGIVATGAGATVAGHWSLTALAGVAAILTWLIGEQLPSRPERRRLMASLSGLLARAGWWLSRDRPSYTAAVVRVERRRGGHTHSMVEIRAELAGPILEAADRDSELDRLLDDIADEISVTIHGVARIDAGRKSARFRMATYAKINDFANSVLTQATQPGAHRTVRPYGEYSATMLKLAAACRLADRSMSASAGT